MDINADYFNINYAEHNYYYGASGTIKVVYDCPDTNRMRISNLVGLFYPCLLILLRQLSTVYLLNLCVVYGAELSCYIFGKTVMYT